MPNVKKTGHTGPDNILEQKVTRIDESLEVMERHAEECQDVELGVQEAMKKRDREYKDEHLHSVPRARKHSR